MIREWPASSRPRTVVRSSALPSPRDIRPLKSRMVMTPSWRVVANNVGISFLRFLVRRRIRTGGVAVSVARRTPKYRQPLGHDKLRPAGSAREHIELVHKGLHQEY